MVEKERSFEYLLNHPDLPVTFKNKNQKLTKYYRKANLKFFKIMIENGSSIKDVEIDRKEKFVLANDWNNYYTYNDWLYYLKAHDKDLKEFKVR